MVCQNCDTSSPVILGVRIKTLYANARLRIIVLLYGYCCYFGAVLSWLIFFEVIIVLSIDVWVWDIGFNVCVKVAATLKYNAVQVIN